MMVKICTIIAAIGAFTGIVNGAEIAKNYPGSPTYPNATAWGELRTILGTKLVKCPGNEACGGTSLRADYALLAETARDISSAMKFATKHRLRVTVRNTGHDFLARHSGVGGLTVSTHNIKGVQWSEAWKPTAGKAAFVNRQIAAPQPAVVMGAGNTWATVTAALRSKRQAVVHGAQSTVGVSGWTMGGGHGPYTSTYGMGCDNALEFQVVLTNGDIVAANEDSYPDLYWALRGGGGTTFGITTRLTMKTFPTPSMNSVTLRVSGTRNAYLSAMAYFFAMTPNMTDFGLTGYPTMTMTSYMGMLTAPGKSRAQIQSFVNPIATRMRSYGASVSFSGGLAKGLYKENGEFDIPDALADYFEQKTRNMSLQKRQRLDFSPLHRTPVNDMASRLISRKALNEANLPAIKKMLSGMTGNILPYGNIGGAVTRNRKLDVGLNPAWRNSVMHLIAINYNMKGNIAAMDPLSENHGAYWNEANDHETDWKTTFWGPKAHYDKLLAIKQKYDPTNTLWCMPCVGGDVYTLQQGKLYLAGKS